ncbi:MAG: hypothetical protein JNM93_01005 [Bacteriovoracaceae bacterium]|nr:hypothetical protein [Bacteriovoracaceae bacterium]
MNKKILPDFPKKKISAPYSKSYLNRALILGSLLPEKVVIKNLTLAQDVVDMLEALEQLGLDIRQTREQIEIKNSFPACESKAKKTIKTGEGGTTTRFLSLLVSRGTKKYKIQPAASMKSRPNSEMLKILTKLKVKCDAKKFPMDIQGPGKATEMSVDCSESTQFLSALKLVYFENQKSFKPSKIKNSAKYLAMTDFVIDKMLKNKTFEIPVDYSGMANFMALGLVNNGVYFDNAFEKDSLQGDSQILDFIKEQGGEYIFSRSGLEIKPLKKIEAFTWDCSDCLDLVPVLAFLASLSDGECVLENIKNLEMKESNRIKSIEEVLAPFGVKCYYDQKNESLQITPPTVLRKNASLSPASDHRIVMLGALLLKMTGGGRLENCESVNKSYPDFFEHL